MARRQSAKTERRGRDACTVRFFPLTTIPPHLVLHGLSCTLHQLLISLAGISTIGRSQKVQRGRGRVLAAAAMQDLRRAPSRCSNIPWLDGVADPMGDM